MIGIIGGSGVYDPEILTEVREDRVATPFGEIRPCRGRYRGLEVVFLPRHGAGHTVPPHLVNYRANIWGLRRLGVRRVIATAAVGSLRRRMRPGDAVIIDQFLDFTKSRPATFFAGGALGVAHLDYTEPYCGEVRRALFRAARAAGLRVHGGGCYACMEGPRFETPAEIRMLGRLGADVVGMTTVPEVVLAREAGMCYATAAMVTNYAAGMAGQALSHQEVLDLMSANAARLRRLFVGALLELPGERACRCASGPPLPEPDGDPS
ncbi:MAG: S-methyl-5'-thioadenosine phosphorylase [Patescibacteria group bacterium]